MPKCLGLLLCVVIAGCAARPSLWVDMGQPNAEHGLAVPSAGDGMNAPDTIAGRPCRHIVGTKSLYLYIQADEASVPPGNHDAYLAVEYFDRAPGVARVEYDAAPERKELNSWYTTAPDVIVMVGSGQWRRAVVHLPNARFGKGQNHRSDLRLCSPDIAVGRIEIHFSKPADYAGGGLDPALVEKVRAQIGKGMELTFGAGTGDVGLGLAQLLRALGATSVESYVTWQTVEDGGQGRWDWSRWDRQMDLLQQAGLKWVPLVITGPGYATPKWFRESDRSVPYVCLEHGQPSKIQSLWNPKWRAWVERFLRAFAERYRSRGVLESVMIGITGTYGESLYPSGPETGWTYKIPGPFHNHLGWWAGDAFAVADFRRYLQKRYADVAALNRAWNANVSSLDAVTPFLPDEAVSPLARRWALARRRARARLDLVNWYTQAMTDWSVFWVASLRKHLPDTAFYLSVGGAGEPVLGADFSAIAKAIAPYAAGIRITNEASDYAVNFTITREVATACRAFGTCIGNAPDVGREPAGGVTPDGNVARLYNATASGARQLFCYTNNVLQNAEAIASFRQYAPFLERRLPRVHAAVYLPKTAWALEPDSRQRLFAIAKLLRDRADLEFIDRTTLGAPALRDVRVMAMAEAPWAEAAEIQALRDWVAGGGVLLAPIHPDRPLLRTPEGSLAERDALFASPPADAQPLRMTLDGKPPRRFSLQIGKDPDADFLFGDWHSQEKGGEFPDPPEATKRWGGARAGIYLPCDPASDATLSLLAYLHPNSLPAVGRSPNVGRSPDVGRVVVNGVQVGTVDKPGPHRYSFAVPRAVLQGRPVAEMTLEITTFKPQNFGVKDSRDLGLGVCLVELSARGAENEPPALPALRPELDWECLLRDCVRRIGNGVTLAVPCRTAYELSEVVVQTLVHPERFTPGAKGIVLPSPARDGVFATQFDKGVLFYNANAEPKSADGVTVPARGIAWKAGERP